MFRYTRDWNSFLTTTRVDSHRIEEYRWKWLLSWILIVLVIKCLCLLIEWLMLLWWRIVVIDVSVIMWLFIICGFNWFCCYWFRYFIRQIRCLSMLRLVSAIGICWITKCSAIKRSDQTHQCTQGQSLLTISISIGTY